MDTLESQHPAYRLPSSAIMARCHACHADHRLDEDCPKGARNTYTPAPAVDLVNHPPHYSQGNMEAIDVIEAFAATNYHRGNALKYLLRANYKGHQKQDLEKAVWYIQREIERL